VRRDGSRYCPQCLAGRDGRWLLAWRLPWVFACTRHRLLLCDRCPACGQPPRAYAGAAAGRTAPGTCPNPVTRRTWCGADLRAGPARRLAPGGRLLAAQHWISAVLASGDSMAGATTAAQVLGDLSIVAGWLLRQSSAGDFARFGPDVRDAWHAWAAQPAASSSALGCFAPADAGLAGAVAAWSMRLITGEDTEAIDRIRPLLRHEPGHWPARPAGFAPHQWKRLSSPARGRFLQALDGSLTPADRIRHRSGTSLAAIPADSPGVLAARARKIPQLLWPDWAIRLTPAEGFLPGPFRSTIAACLLLPGNPARTIRQVITSPHAYRSSFTIGQAIRGLAEQGHATVLAAICHLADYLDTCGSAIDYQHRRDTIAPEMITKDQWQDLSYQAGAHPGEARRLLDARRYLYQLLTGADLYDTRHELAFGSASDRSYHLAFTDTLTSPLRAALHGYATRYLAGVGIEEPLTWQPPAGCCDCPGLPGRDPADIDLQAVSRLVITDGLPASTAAERLGTSTDHIRLVLEQVPRAPRQWGANAAPAAWRRHQRARQILTREFFEREYVHGSKRLWQLEAETGYNRAILASYARQAGISLRKGADATEIDRDWLREQYIRRKRSTASIGAEIGTSDETVARSLRQHGLPVRPPGVHSRPEMTAALAPDIPRGVRRAVEGGLHGWLRLQRFQAAMANPTINAAAAHLGVDQATLIRQFRRLENDSGGPLYHRSTSGQPLRPTRRGKALLETLQQPRIAELMRQSARTSAPPHRPPPPRTRTRPPSQAELSLAFYATITARKIRTTPAVHATLQVLLDTTGELYGEQIASLARLGSGTIYQLLARLASAGWITSCKEDRQTCQDRNRHQPSYRLRIRRTYHALTHDGRKAALHELTPQQSNCQDLWMVRLLALPT
jgi:hypothetical protein